MSQIEGECTALCVCLSSTKEDLCGFVFAKVTFTLARNMLVFELADLHMFIAKEAGVSRLDFAFVHKCKHTLSR